MDVREKEYNDWMAGIGCPIIHAAADEKRLFRYDWKRVFDGNIHELEIRDKREHLASLRTMLYAQARQRGIELWTKYNKKDNILIFMARIK